MAWVDWAILIVLAVSTFAGMSQGFFRSVCSLIGLIAGLVLAAWNYSRAANLFNPFVHDNSLADALGFLAIALLAMALASLVGSVLQQAVKRIGLGCLDMLGGAFVGFLQGGVLILICVMVAVAFFPQAGWLTGSRLPRLFFGMCQMGTCMSPDALSSRVNDGLRLLEHISPQWMHP